MTKPTVQSIADQSTHETATLPGSRLQDAVDPVFVQRIETHRHGHDPRNDFAQTQPSNEHAGVLRTKFQIQLAHGHAERLWSPRHCLLSLYIRKDETCTRRLLVWQDAGSVLCASVESGPRFDAVAGTFFSGEDPFLLDAISEMHAIVYLNLARQRIIDEAAQLLAPIASKETGEQLGQRLGSLLTTSAGEKFLDGLTSTTLMHTRPVRTDRPN